MANVLTSNPMTIDTASASALLTGYMKVSAIWHTFDGATPSDLVIIQDAQGVLVQTIVASLANENVRMSFPDGHPLMLDGLLVPTLANGTLHLYLQDPPPAT